MRAPDDRTLESLWNLNADYLHTPRYRDFAFRSAWVQLAAIGAELFVRLRLFSLGPDCHLPDRQTGPGNAAARCQNNATRRKFLNSG